VLGVEVAARIAASQLVGLSRTRTAVRASPFVGLVAPGEPGYANYAVAEHPGRPVRDIGDSLAILGPAFEPNKIRFELIDEASPGAVEALLEAGLTADGRYPVLTLDTQKLIMPSTPLGVTVGVVRSKEDAIDAKAVADSAFGMVGGKEPDEPGPPELGGYVVARLDGTAVAAAGWLPVADGVTEIAGVATRSEYRKRGLGALVTAVAVRAAAERAGVTLAWLTPGSDGADRIYRGVGFAPVATAVHLTLSDG
jgi:GNAT superfamily N-acetyltransferase